ncbi:unnamed protein product, partial [Dibothriocephalus latus]
TQSGPKDQGATAISEIDTDFNHDAQSLFIQSQKIDKACFSLFDYKETGFCSFGDSCKFLHDRSDYKHGWQIDQEVAEGTYGVEGVDDRYEIKDDEGDDDADDHLPLKCMICRGDYKDPVVTRCYACTEDTKGTFKIAKDLLARIAAIKAKCKAVSEEEEEAEEAGHPCHHDKDDHPCKTVHEHVHNEHYISSSELEDSSDDDALSSSKTNYPTLTRLEGAQPQAPEYCDKPMDDFYQLFGCGPSDNLQNIRSTLRKEMLLCHPDKCQSLSAEEQRERRDRYDVLHRAWKIFGDDDKRRRYNALLLQAKLQEDSAQRPIQAEVLFSDFLGAADIDYNSVDPEEVLEYPCRCGGAYSIRVKETNNKKPQHNQDAASPSEEECAPFQLPTDVAKETTKRKAICLKTALAIVERCGRNPITPEMVASIVSQLSILSFFSLLFWP